MTENINSDEKEPLSKEMLFFMLDEMANSIENLPQHAKLMPITHYDFSALIILISLLLKVKE